MNGIIGDDDHDDDGDGSAAAVGDYGDDTMMTLVMVLIILTCHMTRPVYFVKTTEFVENLYTFGGILKGR
jgi:hypothetical protein